MSKSFQAHMTKYTHIIEHNKCPLLDFGLHWWMNDFLFRFRSASIKLRHVRLHHFECPWRLTHTHKNTIIAFSRLNCESSRSFLILLSHLMLCNKMQNGYFKINEWHLCRAQIWSFNKSTPMRSHILNKDIEKLNWWIVMCDHTQLVNPLHHQHFNCSPNFISCSWKQKKTKI